MAPKAGDERKRLDRNHRFRGHGAHLWIVLDQRLWPRQWSVSERCANLTRRSQADHWLARCSWTVQRVSNVGCGSPA